MRRLAATILFVLLWAMAHAVVWFGLLLFSLSFIGYGCALVVTWLLMPLAMVAYFFEWDETAINWLAVPINSLIYGTFWFVLAKVIGLRLTSNVQPGLCPSCGYDLRATTGPACPECGAATPVDI